jgi:hypothetical protein
MSADTTDWADLRQAVRRAGLTIRPGINDQHSRAEVLEGDMPWRDWMVHDGFYLAYACIDRTKPGQVKVNTFEYGSRHVVTDPTPERLLRLLRSYRERTRT